MTNLSETTYIIQYSIGSRILYKNLPAQWLHLKQEGYLSLSLIVIQSNAAAIPAIVIAVLQSWCATVVVHCCQCPSSSCAAIVVCCHCRLLHWWCAMVMWHRWAQWGERNGAKYEGVGTTISSLQASS